VANTRIQIKRSLTSNVVVYGTGATQVANGELAYTANGDYLYIGSNGAVVQIGGKYVAGTLTANQAMVVNSTSWIDKVQTANLVANGIWANGSAGVGGYVLFSGGAGANAYWGGAGGLGANTDAPYSWTNTHTFSNTVTFNANTTKFGTNLGANVVIGSNSTLAYVNISSNSTTTNSTFYVNTTAIYLGNSTVNAVVNSTVIAIGGVSVVNSSGPMTLPAYVVNTSGSFSLGGNTTLAGTNTVFSSNATFSANAIHSGALTTLGGTNTYITSNVTITGANIDATSAVLRVQDATISGNLTVSGTLATIDVTNIKVKDNIIALADGQTSTGAFTDAVDTGFFAYVGNTASQYYPGLFRTVSNSTNATPYFILGTADALPGSTITVGQANVGSLKAYLNPWGAGGAFVVNSTAMALTANTTVSLAMAANTLSLPTVLPVSSGGPGANIASWTGNNIAVSIAGAALSALLQGGDGTILQSNNGTLVFGGIDCGTF